MVLSVKYGHVEQDLHCLFRRNYSLCDLKNVHKMGTTGQNIVQGYLLKGNRPGTMWSIIYQQI